LSVTSHAQIPTPWYQQITSTPTLWSDEVVSSVKWGYLEVEGMRVSKVDTEDKSKYNQLLVKNGWSSRNGKPNNILDNHPNQSSNNNNSSVIRVNDTP
jgi:hypothetical protein